MENTVLIICLSIIGLVLITILIRDRELFIRTLPNTYKKFDIQEDRLKLELFLVEVLSNPAKYSTAIINFDRYYVQYSFNILDDKMISYLCETISDHYITNPNLALAQEKTINWEALSKYGYKCPTKHFKNYHKDMAVAKNHENNILVDELFQIMEEVYQVKPAIITINYF